MLKWQDDHPNNRLGLLKAILKSDGRIVLPWVVIREMDRHNHNSHPKGQEASRDWLSDESMLRETNYDSEYKARMSFKSKSKNKLNFVERQSEDEEDLYLTAHNRIDGLDNDRRIALYAQQLMSTYGEHRVGVL